jgi:hypothetical protein
MLEMIEFGLVIAMIMVFGYCCGALAFKLQERYYGKDDDDGRR